MKEPPSPEEERAHVIKLLKEVKKALSKEDAFELKRLSNYTIHSASTYQDDRSILLAVLVYSLSKILERKENLKIKDWKEIVRKINFELDKIIECLKKKEEEKKCIYHLKEARQIMTKASPRIKEHIKEVLRKAAINKASRVYEHGISMERTADLLGVTIWELSEYIGQTPVSEVKQNITIDVRSRAKTALDFLTK